jgi:hypothetical protein
MNTPNVGPCGASIVYQIIAQAMSADAVPIPMYQAVYFQDASGQFPENDTYARQFVGWWSADQLVGIKPAVPPVPTYGDTVLAVQACVGSYIPDPLIVGKAYKVVGLAAYTTPGQLTLIGQPAGGVVLNPVEDDTVHRGDGYYGLWVPFSCVAKVTPSAAIDQPPQLWHAALFFVEPDEPEAPPPPAPQDSYLAIGLRYCPNVDMPPGSEPYSTVERGRRYRVTPIREGFWSRMSKPYAKAQDIDRPALGYAVVSVQDCLDPIP